MRDQLFDRMMRPADKLTMVRRVLTALWLSLSLIEFGVWAMVCLIGWELQTPWFLWTVGPGGLVVGAFWLFTKGNEGAR